MTTIDPTTSLGAIVTDHPALARDLDRLGLDYCCGGQRAIADACAERGLDLGSVIEVLSRGAEGAATESWAAMGPAELVDHIEALPTRTSTRSCPASRRCSRRSKASTANATPSWRS